MRGKGSKLGEPCPKVRLSQDRLPMLRLRTNVVRANVASNKCHSTEIAPGKYFLLSLVFVSGARAMEHTKG